MITKTEFTNTLKGEHGTRSDLCIEYYTITLLRLSNNHSRFGLSIKLNNLVHTIYYDSHSWGFLDGRLVINWNKKKKISYRVGKYVHPDQFYRNLASEQYGGFNDR